MVYLLIVFLICSLSFLLHKNRKLKEQLLKLEEKIGESKSLLVDFDNKMERLKIETFDNIAAVSFSREREIKAYSALVKSMAIYTLNLYDDMSDSELDSIVTPHISQSYKNLNKIIEILEASDTETEIRSEALYLFTGDFNKHSVNDIFNFEKLN